MHTIYLKHTYRNCHTQVTPTVHPTNLLGQCQVSYHHVPHAPCVPCALHSHAPQWHVLRAPLRVAPLLLLHVLSHHFLLLLQSQVSQFLIMWLNWNSTISRIFCFSLLLACTAVPYPPSAFNQCCKITTATTGTFTVSFTTANSGAIFGIGVVCPNTQVAVTCFYTNPGIVQANTVSRLYFFFFRAQSKPRVIDVTTWMSISTQSMYRNDSCF